MKHLKFFVLILLLSSSAFSQRDFAGRVVEVIDGKTVVIEVTGGGKLTAVLQYIEVPEPEQPLSRVISDHLGQLVMGKVVIFRGKGISTGTLIPGELRLVDVDISQQMLRDGAAWHIPMAVSGQDAMQGVVYADNQAMAREQKLGVWSVPGLKPAWEFRAEKEEAARQKALAEKSPPVVIEASPVDTTRSPMKRWSPEALLQANAKSELWPNINRGKRDPSTGIEKTYDMAKKYGIVETGSAFLNMTGPGGTTRRIETRSFYIYFGDEGNTTVGSYGMGFVSESTDSIFQKTTPLLIQADGKKFTLKPLQLITKKVKAINSELILFKIDDAMMQEIAYADKIEVRLGTMSAVIDAETINSMRHLMLARR